VPEVLMKIKIKNKKTKHSLRCAGSLYEEKNEK